MRISTSIGLAVMLFGSGAIARAECSAPHNTMTLAQRDIDQERIEQDRLRLEHDQRQMDLDRKRHQLQQLQRQERREDREEREEYRR